MTKPSADSQLIQTLDAFKTLLNTAEGNGLITSDEASDYFADALDRFGLDYDTYLEIHQ